MKRNKILRVVGIFLVLVMFIVMLSACKKTSEPTETTKPGTTVAPTVAPTQRPRSTTPLVVGYLEFSEKFSPFLQTPVMTTMLFP